MNTTANPVKFKPLRFIILIPHRDCSQILKKYSSSLFSKGLNGSFSFPHVAPLALVKRPFSTDELKKTAEKLRELTLINNGIISSIGSTIVPWPEVLSTKDSERPDFPDFFGLLLDLPWEHYIFSDNVKLIIKLEKPILCCSLIEKGSPLSDNLPACQIRFGAAILANLAIWPLELQNKPFSYEWEISTPVWLSKRKNKDYNGKNIAEE